jgi:hypothetical protein
MPSREVDCFETCGDDLTASGVLWGQDLIWRRVMTWSDVLRAELF